MTDTITVTADRVIEGDTILLWGGPVYVDRISVSPVDPETLHFHCNGETLMTSALRWEATLVEVRA